MQMLKENASLAILLVVAVQVQTAINAQDANQMLYRYQMEFVHADLDHT
jgi:hypothetical protein